MIKDRVIRHQCSYCKFFNAPTNECWFVIDYAIHPDTAAAKERKDVEWYREHDPEAIDVVEDCIVYRDIQGAE